MCGLFSPKEKKGGDAPEPILSQTEIEAKELIEKHEEAVGQPHFRIPFVEIIMGIVVLAIFFSVFGNITALANTAFSAGEYSNLLGLLPLIVVAVVMVTILSGFISTGRYR